MKTLRILTLVALTMLFGSAAACAISDLSIAITVSPQTAVIEAEIGGPLMPADSSEDSPRLLGPKASSPFLFFRRKT